MSEVIQQKNLWRNLVGAGLFLLLTAVSLLTFLHVFAPKQPPERLPPYDAYDKEPMAKAVAAANVRQKLDTILSFGSRFLGQDGFYQTEAHIRKAYTDAGLRVLELPQQTAAPRTIRREILDRDGTVLPDVEIYPFMPNHFQPMVTPEKGLTGKLLLVSDEVLLTRQTFDDCIAVIDAADPPRSFLFQWTKYAQLGFRAVIVAHRDGWEKFKVNITGSVPVNYVRLAASKGIYDHLNQTVTLRVRTEWANVPNTVLIGLLPSPAPTPAREALVITCCYDAASILPDHAPSPPGAAGVAAHLALLDGIQAYKGAVKRDIIFVSYGSQMMAQFPAERLTAILGPALTKDEGLVLRREEQSENAAALKHVQACASCFDPPAFFVSPEATATALASLGPAARALMDDQIRYVLNTLVFNLSEDKLEARIAFVRVGETRTDTAEFAAYRTAKKRYDDAMTAAGYPVMKLVSAKKTFVDEYDLRGKCQARFAELLKFHEEKAREIETSITINRTFRKYDRVITVGSYLVPADPEKTKGEAVTFYMGPGVEGLKELQGPIINGVWQAVIQRMKDLPADVRFESWQGRNHNGWASSRIDGVPVDVSHWNAQGDPAFVFINTDRMDSYKLFGMPFELPYMRNVETIAGSLQIMGRTVLSLAFGNGAFEQPLKSSPQAYSGRVYVSNVGRSIVPNYPLQGALFGHKGNSGDYEAFGYYRYGFIFTDVYGRYSLPFCTASLTPWVHATGGGYSPEAVSFGRDGLIAYCKDEGPQGQTIYKSVNIGWGARDNINIVVFRASPITVLDLTNPQSFKAYTGFSYITKDGLAPVSKIDQFDTANDIVTTFLEPDRPVYLTLKAGAPGNDLLQTTRAFVLGVDDSFRGDPRREIDGRGFLPADTPFLLDMPLNVATSMLRVNQTRLDLQMKYHMADERIQTFHQRSKDLLRQSKLETSKHAANLDQCDAATYTILNHPILRKSISDAVWGILWYLGLLVPFVFFFEKLAFGYADIRKQLVAQGIIFLVVFMLLRLLHPAFEMIRSSLMILLGFVIMLISGGITLLFSGKFQENFEELRKARGRVSAAEVNTLGVMGTAFALGLNNMHRRIVRTGLTCATLVLITFAMICFTSIQSDIVNTATATGKASYQGLLIKRDKMAPISEGELFALDTKYSHKFKVSRRRMLVGTQSWEQINYNPDVEIVYEPPQDLPKKRPVASILGFSADEPLREHIQFVTRRGWFTDELLKSAQERPPVLISDKLAAELGIKPETVDSEVVKAQISGTQVQVYGIFKSESLADLQDLDGRDLLPFDVQAMRTIQIVAGAILAEEKDPRLRADQMIIAPESLSVAVTRAQSRLVSVAVSMAGLTYKQAKTEIDQYLEQSGQTTYYGLDDIACRGKRARQKSFAGMLELLIPLIIAAMTVLNTMRGSVYERRDEIFVYNAVGIAPKYIFAMFFSEAFVYAVVGSELGYLLSQGTGRVLTMLGWTGGLNMTFTSIATIYVSLAIMVAVFISTLFPALSAMEIAAPAEDAGWKLPEPEDDHMRFLLPFTFDGRDRVAVLAFLNRYFVDHGEGSAGRFFADTPTSQLSEKTDPLARDGYIPELAVTVWLKPFDLGVSQRLTIAMPTDPETKEFIAAITLTRLSGTRESWIRLNRTFVSLLRRHFLHWRAVSADDRQVLFAEARQMLETHLSRQRQEKPHG